MSERAITERVIAEIQPGEDVLELLNREYSPERSMPVFSDRAHDAIRAFFQESGYIMVACTLVNPNEVSEIDGSLINGSVATVVSHDETAESQLAILGSIVGPVFLNGEYYSNGIGIWAPNN